jgi:hypothetical protein
MSMMCKLGSGCHTHKSMCGHEKMMIGVLLLVTIGGLVFWLA